MPDAPLARRDGVELIRTGRWQISTGEWTATREDLVAAVAALSCPAVRKPILKIGHTDERFTPGDGEPAIGWIDGMRLADGGHTLIGDYVGMPAWLDQVMASAYPDRSVEGVYNYRCQLEHTHPFVLTGVALLGVTPPGVGTLKSLADVQALYGLAAAEAPGADDALRVAVTIPGGLVHAAAVEHTGAMVALIPTDEDAQRLAVEGGEPADQLHVTLMYLGEAVGIPPRAQAHIVNQVRRAVADMPPVEGSGFALSVFNPPGSTQADGRQRDTCIVLGVSGDRLADVQALAARSVTAVADAAMLDLPAQHSPWTPHITLTYTDDVSQVATLADRAGPVVFDRVRVAFAGEHIDIPLTAVTDLDMPVEAATVHAHASEDSVPNPQPTLTERIHQAWNASGQPEQQWIVEAAEDEVIVMDNTDRSLHRVPVTVNGNAITFGKPQRVRPAYVPADEPVAASRMVFASQAESRPTTQPAPGDPIPLPPPDDAPEPQPTTPVDEPAPELPAAEPEPNNQPTEEDPVSDLSALRSRLGLDDTADEVAVLTAIDALKTKAEAQPDPEQVAASAKENTELRKEVQVLAAQVQTMSAKLADAEKEKATSIKASVLDQAQKDGKFTPADREQWERDYDEAPAAVTRILASIAPGTAVPVQAAGYTTDGEPDPVDPDALSPGELNAWASQLGIDPKELTRG